MADGSEWCAEHDQQVALHRHLVTNAVEDTIVEVVFDRLLEDLRDLKSAS